MELLRQELYTLIEQYGRTDPRTLSKSQELDKLINKEMRGEKEVA